jgi:hypothetical protein
MLPRCLGARRAALGCSQQVGTAEQLLSGVLVQQVVDASPAQQLSCNATPEGCPAIAAALLCHQPLQQQRRPRGRPALGRSSLWSVTHCSAGFLSQTHT